MVVLSEAQDGATSICLSGCFSSSPQSRTSVQGKTNRSTDAQSPTNLLCVWLGHFILLCLLVDIHFGVLRARQRLTEPRKLNARIDK